METLACDTKVVRAGVTVIQQAKWLINANPVLAGIAGAVIVVIATYRNMEAVTVPASVKSAWIAIVNNTGGIEAAIAGKGVAFINGACDAIITIFRNMNTSVADAGVNRAGISIIKCTSCIVYADSVIAEVNCTSDTVVAVNLQAETLAANAGIIGAGVGVRNAEGGMGAISGERIAAVIGANVVVIAILRLGNTLAAEAEIIRAEVAIIWA